MTWKMPLLPRTTALFFACALCLSAIAPAIAQNDTCKPKSYPETGDLPKAVRRKSLYWALSWLATADPSSLFVSDNQAECKAVQPCLG